MTRLALPRQHGQKKGGTYCLPSDCDLFSGGERALPKRERPLNGLMLGVVRWLGAGVRAIRVEVSIRAIAQTKIVDDGTALPA